LGDFVGLPPLIWNGFPAEIRAIALHPKDGPLAIGLSDGSVLLRSLDTGIDRSRLRQHHASITALTFSLDGGRLVSGDSDGTMHIWQVHANGEWALQRTIHAAPMMAGLIPLAPCPFLVPCLDFPTINSLAISPDGKQLAASLFFAPTASHTLPRIIALWNLADGTQAACLGQEKEWLFSPVFSPAGKCLAAAYCRTIREGNSTTTQHGVLVRNLDRSSARRDLPLDTSCILKADYSPDGKILACTCAKGLALFDTATFQPPRYTHENYMPFAFIPHRNLLAIANSMLGQVRLWNVANESDVAVLRHSSGVGDGLRWIACSTDAIVTASPRTVQVWRLAGSGEKLELAGHGKGIPGIAFSPDGTLLASAGKDNAVRIWDAVTGRLLQQLTGFAAEVQTLAFSGDGRMLATGDWAGVIQIWEVLPRGNSADPAGGVMGRQLWSAAPSDHGIGRHLWSVIFSPDGRYLAAGGGFGEQAGGVTLWRITLLGANQPTGACLGMARLPQPPNRGPTAGLAFGPESRMLAWVEQDKSVRLWDLEAVREHPFPRVRCEPTTHRRAFSDSAS
jgi:WD40 repeat protein